MSAPNSPPLPTQAPLPVCVEVDDQHPWLGLDAFTEETSEYFYGRDAEAEELFRRVKREPLTVLFGMSGLGKTSLVRAGLFPALRAEGFLPVYIRLDHEPAAKAPKLQVTEALTDAITAARISPVVTTCTISQPGGGDSAVGALTSTTRAPRRLAASAMA